MTQTIQLRQDGEPSENNTSYESPDVEPRQDVCSMALANEVAESLDSTFIEVTISEEAEVEAELDRATKSYGVYTTPGAAVNHMYIAHDVLSEVTGEESSEEDAPESVGLVFAASDSDAFGEAEEEGGIDEEEAEALIAGGGSESDEEEEETVEIADEEVGLVDN